MIKFGICSFFQELSLLMSSASYSLRPSDISEAERATVDFALSPATASSAAAAVAQLLHLFELCVSLLWPFSL